MKKQKLVVIGNGMAGIRVVEELLALAPDLYDITVFGAEADLSYNRVLLSPVLSGEQAVDSIFLNEQDWYARNRIKLVVGKPVAQIDRVRRLVSTDDGMAEAYDRLVLATGALPTTLPIAGSRLPGVMTYRSMQDVRDMISAAGSHRHALVIGAGLLGLEAAAGLAARGMQVTVVHRAGWLMERQLDPAAGRLLQQSLERRGIAFRLGAQVAALQAGPASARVAQATLDDGSALDTDLVVMALGIRPDDLLARSCGIHCARGIVVNDTMQTYDPRIYAVGDCVSHRGTAHGLVAPLLAQAKVCANHLAQSGIGRYTGFLASTRLKVSGIALFSAGDFMGGAGREEIVLEDAVGEVYKKIVLKDQRVIGACLFGDTDDGPWYQALIQDQQDVSAMREQLMFGRDSLAVSMAAPNHGAVLDA